jgi:hypothetical protein
MNGASTVASGGQTKGLMKTAQPIIIIISIYSTQKWYNKQKVDELNEKKKNSVNN